MFNCLYINTFPTIYWTLFHFFVTEQAPFFVRFILLHSKSLRRNELMQKLIISNLHKTNTVRPVYFILIIRIPSK